MSRDLSMLCDHQREVERALKENRFKLAGQFILYGLCAFAFLKVVTYFFPTAIP